MMFGTRPCQSISSAFYPLKGWEQERATGYRDERAWFEDKSFSHSTIYPSISVPRQSLTGRGSPHSSLSSAQAAFLRSVLSGSLEGGQR